MKPGKLLIFSLLIFCSNLTTYSYTIDSDDNNIIESQLSINIEYQSKDKVKVTVQSFPVSDTNIESYNLVFDMKFREDYEGDFTGVCIGPSWEKFGPGEFSLELEKKNNFKKTIIGEINLSEDDRCDSYFYYLRFLDIQTNDGDKYLVGVATDYAGEYPDAPYIWKQNKLNQIEVIGTSNIEKYSINFELSN
ncbi:hypothetical protein [Winogradskyella sp.]|uniref:hypothetical protein n=1 Tax=Winogradskyella sp. TaxID=1883156 RepID=UPI003519B886